MPKPSEEIKKIFKDILGDVKTAEYIPEKYLWAMCQAIVVYLDENDKKNKSI
jgi:hypothetical protein